MPTPFRTKRGKLINFPIKKENPKTRVVQLAPTTIPHSETDRYRRIETKLRKEIRKAHPSWDTTRVLEREYQLPKKGITTLPK